MTGLAARYTVDDVEAALASHVGLPGVALTGHPARGRAVPARGGPRRAVGGAMGPGGDARPMPDGRRPEPGG